MQVFDAVAVLVAIAFVGQLYWVITGGAKREARNHPVLLIAVAVFCAAMFIQTLGHVWPTVEAARYVVFAVVLGFNAIALLALVLIARVGKAEDGGVSAG